LNPGTRGLGRVSLEDTGLGHAVVESAYRLNFRDGHSSSFRQSGWPSCSTARR